MKLFQSQIQCLKNQRIKTGFPCGFPNVNYPNGGGYCYHNFIEIEMFADGSGLHYLNSIPYHVKKGYFYLLMPGDYHYYSLDESKYFAMYSIQLAADLPSSEILSRISLYPRPYAVYLEGEKYETVLGELEHLHRYCTGENPNDLMAKNIAERVILLMMQNLDHSSQQIYENFPHLISTIVDYVSHHCCDTITSEDMAALTGLTPHYFSSYFSKHTGIVFRDYVNRVRLSKSIELLLNTSLSIQEIAASTGFSSQTYFSRLFSRQFGISPKEYRLTVMR